MVGPRMGIFLGWIVQKRWLTLTTFLLTLVGAFTLPHLPAPYSYLFAVPPAGLLAAVMGCGLILWVCYNEFIHRLPQYSGTHWWKPLGAGPVMVGIGVYWLRSSRSPPKSEHTRI